MPGSLRAIFDTSPLIFLDHLGYLPQVKLRHDLITTPEVVRELNSKEGGAGSRVPQLSWLEQRAPQATFKDLVEQEVSLGAGETSVIALGLQLGLTVVLDDGAARRFAMTKGLPLTGTLGVVVKLHRQELATRSLEQDLRALTAFGMYLSDELKAVVLESL